MYGYLRRYITEPHSSKILTGTLGFSFLESTLAFTERCDFVTRCPLKLWRRSGGKMEEEWGQDGGEA